jgi:hypothetical protein
VGVGVLSPLKNVKGDQVKMCPRFLEANLGLGISLLRLFSKR